MANFKFVGKSVEVNYETGYLFRIDYISDKELRWTSLKERTDGSPMTGVENFTFYEVASDVYFVNWIESGGLVVSQILNFNDLSVYAFMTWEEKGKRGDRGSLLHKGSIKIL